MTRVTHSLLPPHRYQFHTPQDVTLKGSSRVDPDPNDLELSLHFVSNFEGKKKPRREGGRGVREAEGGWRWGGGREEGRRGEGGRKEGGGEVEEGGRRDVKDGGGGRKRRREEGEVKEGGGRMEGGRMEGGGRGRRSLWTFWGLAGVALRLSVT